VWPTPVIPALWASLGYTSEFKASLDLVWRPSLSQKKINPSFNFFFSFFFFGGGREVEEERQLLWNELRISFITDYTPILPVSVLNRQNPEKLNKNSKILNNFCSVNRPWDGVLRTGAGECTSAKAPRPHVHGHLGMMDGVVQPAASLTYNTATQDTLTYSRALGPWQCPSTHTEVSQAHRDPILPWRLASVLF
jgi:hypothetical protein